MKLKVKNFCQVKFFTTIEQSSFNIFQYTSQKRDYVTSRYKSSLHDKNKKIDWTPLRRKIVGQDDFEEESEKTRIKTQIRSPFPEIEDEGEIVKGNKFLPHPPAFEIKEENDDGIIQVNIPIPREVTVDSFGWAYGRGARKRAHALARVKPGVGEFFVNGKLLANYFPILLARDRALHSLIVTEKIGKLDVHVNVHGGGQTGQSHAIMMATADAIQSLDPIYHWSLKKNKCLTRDSRRVERKKTGKPKARKSKQWSKR
eukprot:TRINITY_DN950_c0_g1_i1.p1 TRINITY_DN950_c0_g1~~TRINITY_DN950_c0_g1_i1.p1  ORF type:complete len:273 (-),score=85.48 TRINITY_DN950_c0_g1_i1:97-870(-)